MSNSELNKTAVTAAPIHELIAERWSPRAYDSSHTLAKEEIVSILEAARWAPSANNVQPWRFSVAERGTDLHAKVVAGLSGFNASWAPAASALIVVSMQRTNEDGSPRRISWYDAGLAVANLSLQAQSLGLHTHQMAGILHDDLHKSLELANDLEVLLVVTVGKVAPASQLQGPAYDREVADRTRLPLSEIVLHGNI